MWVPIPPLEFTGFTFYRKMINMAMTFNQRVATQAAARGATNVRGPFIDTILPILIQFLTSCLTPKPVPTPQPATSIASADSWKIADESKDFAISKIASGDSTAETVVYKKTVSNAAARAIMQKQRKAGDKITKDEAVAIALAYLDQARLGDLEENAEKIDDTKSE